jgi:hypothetical protein
MYMHRLIFIDIHTYTHMCSHVCIRIYVCTSIPNRSQKPFLEH